jgi:hypothetical protein
MQIKTEAKASPHTTSTKRIDGFDGILLRAVDRALFDTLGESGVAVIKFYVDTSLILNDPEKFQGALRNIFTGSEFAPMLFEDRIERYLADSLQQNRSISIPTNEWKEQKTFRQFILACKRQFELAKV